MRMSRKAALLGGGLVVDPILNNNTWAVIKKVSDRGLGANYWSVGDRKVVTLGSTTVGEGSLAGTYYVYILGFDHNSGIEGTNKIHFQFGFTSLSGGINIGFTDSYYNTTGSTAAFRMNTTAVNTGGWSSSYMRNTICTDFKNALPSDLQAVLKTVTKYTDNTGGGSDTASYVTATTETIFLLSEFEIRGVRAVANSAEQSYQKQYQYYINGNSYIKHKHSATDTAVYWWMRSLYVVYATRFCVISATGGVMYSNANFSQAFVPAFCV